MRDAEVLLSDDVRRLARGTGILLPATLVGNALLLGLDFYVNGVLGNAGYGVFNAVTRVMGLAGFVVLLGMENAVIRYVARSSVPDGRSVAMRAAAWVCGASVIAATLLIVTAPRTAAWVDPSPGTALALQIAAVSLPFAGLRMVAVAAAQGWGEVTPRAVLMFLVWPMAQIIGVTLIWSAGSGSSGSGFGAGSGGVAGVTAAYTLSMAMGAGLAVVFAVRAARRSGEARQTSADAGSPTASGNGSAPSSRAISSAELLRFAWPLWAQGILMALYTWADQVLLAGLRSAEDAGIYGPVARLAPLFGLGLGALNGMFAPMIAEKHAAGKQEELQALYRTVTRWALVIALPPAVLSLVRPEVVLGVWPHGSPEASDALRVTVVAQLVCTAVGSVNYLLIMAGRERMVLWNAIPAVIVNFAASFLLIPRYGPVGAALANALAMVFANVLAFLQVRSTLQITPFRSFGIGRAAVASVLAGLAVAFIPAGFVCRVVPIGALAGRWVEGALFGMLTLAVFGGALGLLGLDADDRVVINVLRQKFGRGARPGASKGSS